MARERRRFTKEFKDEAVRLVKEGDRSVGQVAKVYVVSVFGNYGLFE